MRIILPCILLVFFAVATICDARSAFGPRHSGIEPPDSPRPLEGLPGNAPSRTAEGGMGYTDAYGNTVRRDEAIPEKKPRKRLPPGAYGSHNRQEPPINIPEKDDGPPLWRYK